MKNKQWDNVLITGNNLLNIKHILNSRHLIHIRKSLVVEWTISLWRVILSPLNIITTWGVITLFLSLYYIFVFVSLSTRIYQFLSGYIYLSILYFLPFIFRSIFPLYHCVVIVESRTVGGAPMLTIGGGGGDGFRATWSIFIELCFEYCLKYS